MKRFKLLMVLPLVFTIACSKTNDPKTEYLNVMTTMADQNSYMVTGNGELSMDIPIDPDNPDSTIGLTIPFDMDIAINDIQQSMNMDLTMDLSILGQTIDYGFYIRDQYIYLEVLDQKGAVPLDPTIRSMVNTIFTYSQSTIDDDLPISLSSSNGQSVFTIKMDNDYFQTKFNELSDTLGQTNTNFDSIDNIEFNQTITVNNSLIETTALNGHITVNAIPIDITLSLTYGGYNQTDVKPITPSDYPIQSDGQITTTLPLDQMV